MKQNSMHHFETEQWLPVSVEKAWDFFSSPFNLSLITPPEMGFKILSQLNVKPIHENMLINYSVKPLFNIPVKWTTEIINVCEGKYFTDRQVKGPYTIWEHTHTFEKKGDGVLIKDVVKYQLPFGALGILMHRLIVRSKIISIFEFRKLKLEKIFGK